MSPGNSVNPNPTVQPQSGPVTINITTSTYQGIPYDLYYPSNYTGSLVVLAGGIKGDKQFLVGWAETLAQGGYAALAFTTQSQDLQHVAQYVVECKANLQVMLSFVFNQSAFPLKVNPSGVSLMGMSGGGATVLSLSDPRVKSIISVCPYYVENSTAPIKEPVLIITGQNDYFAPHSSNGAVYYSQLNQTKMIVEQANLPDQDGHDITSTGWKYTFAWLNYYVESNPGALSTINGVTSDSAILDSARALP